MEAKTTRHHQAGQAAPKKGAQDGWREVKINGWIRDRPASDGTNAYTRRAWAVDLI
jgi:hypothetical protein